MTRVEDEEAVRRAAAGDRGALESLWRAHRRWLAAVLVAQLPPRVDWEDLLQEVALKMTRGIATLDDPSRLRPWLRSIALNEARMAVRSATRRVDGRAEEALDLELRDPAATDALGATARRDELDRTLAAARELPPELSEPLLLRAVRGLSQAEIARALDLSETTVESRLARARRRLRARVELARGFPAGGAAESLSHRDGRSPRAPTPLRARPIGPARPDPKETS